MITQSWRCQVWKLRQVSSVILGGAISITGWFAIASIGGNPALAQITLDATLGAESSVVAPNPDINGIPSDQIQINGGAIRGVNLFHSFQEFNINEGQGVYFTNPSGIENILSRVTGSNPSNIQGMLGVTGGDANLFLLNPNGIIFGPNARLSVSGSFLASTANSFTFPDGTQFSATNPEPAPLLTVNVPIGLQYGGNAGGIQVQQGATLEVLPGKTLALVGGNVSVTGGRLLAQGGELPPPSTPGGRVELGGLAGAGTVVVNADGTLSFPDGVARADVSLTNAAQVNVSAGDGGSIAVNARNFDISERSRLIGGIKSRMGGDGAQAGDIVVNATGAVTLAGRDSTIRNSVNTDSIGQSGDIEITAESLSLTGGAQLDTTIYDRGQGKAGNIRVRVDETVTLEGVEGRRSRIHSEVEEEAKGNGGDISIEAKSVYLTNGSQLNTQTSGEGNAGNIKLTLTDTLSLDRVGNNQPSSISSPVAEGARGNGGNISVIAESVFVTNGGQFNLTTRGAGNAGSLSISAGSTVSFDGDFQRSDGNILSSIAKTQVEETGVGNAGNIEIKARSVSITNGAELLSDTYNQGDAGDITIVAQDLVLVDGVSPIDPSNPESPSSGIISSVQKDAIGNGGNINITVEVGSLFVTNGGFVDTVSHGQGYSGNMTIAAGNGVFVAGAGSNGATSIVDASVTSANQGGNLTITTEQLTIWDGGQVSVSSTGLGSSGSLTVDADFIVLENKGMLSAATASGEGGDISLQVDGYILMRGNSLISAEADNNGSGGNIMINAPFIVAVAKEDNDIIANAFQGQGGNINLTAQGIYGLEYKPQLSSLSDINASSEFGVDGVVEFNTPDFDPTQGVAKLPDEPVNSPEVAEGCQGGGKQGTVAFFNAGRGGLAPSPHEALSPIQLWEDMPQSAQGTENPVVADIASSSPVAPPNAIIEAQGWITNEKGEVTLVAEVPATQSQGRCRLR